MLKRIFCLILAFSMLVSACPVSAAAEETETIAEATWQTEETVPETTPEPTVSETEEPVPETAAAAEETEPETTAATEPEVTEAPTEATEAETEPTVPETVPEAAEGEETAKKNEAKLAAVVESGTCGENLTWTLDEEGTLTISGTGYMNNYYNSDSPWYQNTQITKIIVEDGVTSLGAYAFYGCTNLTSVTIPDSVTSLGDYCFYKCTNISNITLPDSVTALGERCFCQCSSLTSITIPDSVTKLGNHCFYYCTSLSSITIPGSVTSLPDGCFSQCTSLSSITIPDGVTSLGPGCFRYCSGLTYVTIPDSVTTVGNDCFSHCTGLTSIELPDSITGYGLGSSCFNGCTSLTSVKLPKNIIRVSNSCFYDCSSLTSIEIPNGVTDLSVSCFAGCNDLKTISLPDSLTSIGYTCFEYCYNLTSITIPDGVTLLDRCFWNCTSLKSVTLSKNLTAIDSYCFRGCSSLTSIEIPASVTEIGVECFRNCTGLKSIVFKGDAPSIAYNAFKNTSTTAYYSSSNATWSSDMRANYGGSIIWSTVENLAQNIPDDQYAILVRDISGQPIADATVTWSYGSKISTTDFLGSVYFDRYTVGQPTITVTCDGYESYTTEGKNYQKSDRGYDVITLVRSDSAEELYRLESARYVDTILGLDGFGRDVLHGTKELSEEQQDFGGVFDLRVSAYADASKINYYVLMEDGAVVARCDSSGHFEGLKISEFTPGKKLSVRVWANDGTMVDTPINLIITDDTPVKITSIQFGDKVSIEVGPDFPFIGGIVGGGKLEFDIPDLGVDAYLDSEGTHHLGINAKIYDPDGKKTRKEQWEEIKETIQQLKKLDGVKVGKGMQKKIDKIMKEKKSAKIPAAGEVNVNFLGYAEGKPGSHLKGYMCFTLSGSKTIPGPTVVVVVVPVTYNVKVGVDGQLSGEIQYSTDTDTLSGDAKLTITPKLNAFGGAGVGKVVGVGAYGSAELPIECQIIGTTTTPGLNSVDLTGELGLKVYAGPFEYEHSIRRKTWHLYTRTNAKMVSASAPSYMSAAYSQDNYEVAELSYLSGSSYWKGAAITSSDPLDLSPLQENTYRNSQPVLGDANGTPILVWVSAKAERSSINATQVMYSLYKSGIWTAPAAVDSANVSSETSPALATAGDGTLYLAYQRSRTELAADASMADYAAAQEIVVSRFDGTAFAEPTVLSPAEGYHHTPSISAENGTVTVLWASNSDTSDLFGQNTTNAVSYAQLADSAWSQSETLVGNLNAIAFARVGNVSGKLTAAVVTDGDNDLSTTADRTLTAYADLGTGTAVSTGSVGHVEFGQLPGKTAGSLTWSDASGLSSWNGSVSETLLEATELSSGYRILSDRILYAAAAEDSAELYALVYENGAWASPVAVTKQGKDLQYYDVKTIGNTTFAAATQVDATISEDSVEDVCTLAWCKLSSFTDLGLTAAHVDDALASSGNAYTLTADIANNGDAALSGFTVTVSSGSTVMATQAVAESLIPGTQTSVEVSLPALTSGDANKVLTVSVSADGDLDPENDTMELATGFADLETTAEFINYHGRRFTAIATVTNNSCIPAAGTLSVSYQGSQIAELEVARLGAGESSIYEIELTKDSLNGNEEGMLEFKVVTSETEYNDQNNAYYINARISHIHEYDSVVTAPTCTEQGYTTYTCECGDSYTDSYTDTTDHSWDEGTVTREPTEEEEGEKTFTCSDCGETKTETLPKAEHIHKYEAVVTEPTCTEQGYTTHTCECGDSYVDSYTDTADHSFGEWTVTRAPTETEEGEKQRSCTVCDYAETETIPVITAEAPVIRRSVDDASGKPVLRWSALDSAVEYQIYRRAEAESKYTLVETVTETTFTDTEAEAGTKYYYKVKTGYGEVTSGYSNAVSALCKLETPTLKISGNTTTGKPRVSWNKVEGAAKYRVYRATSKSGTYSFLKTTVSASSCTDTTAKAGTNYYYKVKAMHENEDADSGWSNIVNRVCDLPKPTVTLTVKTATGQPVVKWETVTGAAKYRVYRAESEDGSYELVYTGVSTRSYTDTAAEAGIEYFYKVKAVHSKSSADSAYSAVVSRVCDLAKPVVSIRLTSGGDPRLTWDAVEGAAKYRVYRASSKDGSYKLVKTTVTATSFTDKDAKSGKTWYYKVKAIHGNTEANSAYSSIKYIKAK